MINLLSTELLTQKKAAFWVPFIMLPLFYFLEDVTTQNNMISTIIISLAVGFISYFLTVYSNSDTGETERNQYKLLLSLPVSRTNIVLSKYFIIFVWWLIPYFWLIIVLAILKYVLYFPIEQSILSWQIALFSLCTSYFMNSIFYPIYFKYGAKTANIVGVITFFIVSNGLGKVTKSNSGNTLVYFISNHPYVAVSSTIIVLVLVSFLISLTVFSKKDF